MKELTSRTKGLKTGSAKKIYEYLRDHHANIEKNPIGVLISYLKRLEGVKVGPYEGSMKTRELQNLYKLEEIQELLPSLRDLCGKRKVLVLVDELDKGWDASEDARAFVAGLFHAAMDINDKADGPTVLLSLRRELYDNIPALYEDAQKYRDVIEMIQWSEDELLDLISRRIQHSFPQKPEEGPEDLWNLVFGETLEYRQTRSFNYMVDRTLYRPRELIHFCTLIRDQVSQTKSTLPANYSLISEAEAQYSEDRVKDIGSEWRFSYPGLESVFEAFRGLSYNFDREDLEFHLLGMVTGEHKVSDTAKAWVQDLEPEDLIGILWKVGFLRAQAVGGLKARRRSGSRYLGPHQIPSLSLANVPRFHIHPMFRDFLGLKETKTTR